MFQARSFDMKKILLLGDSIRMSYQDKVKELLTGQADVVWPEINGSFAKFTLWFVNLWITQLGNPDIIHWNNGIWDAYHLNNEMGIFTSIEDYIRDLGRVLKELRKANAQIIWASTTAVGNNCTCCRNDEIDAYNLAAATLMKKEFIPIDNLNAVVKQNPAKFLDTDQVHLTEAGQFACAVSVVASTKRFL
jgi:hypothetical protein